MTPRPETICPDCGKPMSHYVGEDENGVDYYACGDCAEKEAAALDYDYGDEDDYRAHWDDYQEEL